MERTTTEGHGSRRLVASYGTYAEAQEAVDRLADEGFPVELTGRNCTASSLCTTSWPSLQTQNGSGG
jgi:hypothetical protein